MSRLAGVMKVGRVSVGGAAAITTIVDWDLSAPGLGLPVINNASLGVRGLLVGYSSGADYGRIEVVADFKRVAGTVSQIGAPSTVPYSAFDAALSGALGSIDFNGNSIRLRVDDSAVVPAVDWSGYLWLYSSLF